MSSDALSRAESVYRAELGPAHLIEFDISPLDDVGLPAVATWWADVRADGWAGGGIGYGASPQHAVVGALGETVERALGVRGLLALDDRRDGSERDLVAALGRDRVADPRTLGLPAGTDYDQTRPLHWVPTTRLGDGATVWVPVEFVASGSGDLPERPPPGGWLIHPVTNGLGAGLSRDAAVAHALGEILQRDGNGLTFRALDRGIVLDLAGFADPATTGALQRLERAGVTTTVKLAATDNGVLNVYVVGSAPGDDLIVATACGEAAHPDADVAIRKAVLEFAAARVRKAFMHGPLDPVRDIAPPDYLDAILDSVDPAAEEQRVLAAMLAWVRLPPERWRPLLEATVFSRREVVSYADLPRSAADGEPLDRLLSSLGAAGFEVLVADFVGAAGAHAVKVIVPGMEVESVAYARIGERNARRLLDMDRDDLLRIGESPPGWSSVALTPAAVERLGGPAWLDRRRLDQVTGDLLPLYREPGRHALQIALSRGM